MAEQERDYELTTLCVPVSFARSTDAHVATNVKAIRGRWTKEDLERQGLVPLGRHPAPDLPGLMTISDPKVDRVNREIRMRKEARQKATRAPSDREIARRKAS